MTDALIAIYSDERPIDDDVSLSDYAARYRFFRCPNPASVAIFADGHHEWSPGSRAWVPCEISRIRSAMQGVADMSPTRYAELVRKMKHLEAAMRPEEALK